MRVLSTGLVELYWEDLTRATQQKLAEVWGPDYDYEGLQIAEFIEGPSAFEEEKDEDKV